VDRGLGIASHRLVLGLLFRDAPSHLVARGSVAVWPHDEDDVQRPVGVTVSAEVESVPDGFAAGDFSRADASNMRVSFVKP
jgi:hypothetical protein